MKLVYSRYKEGLISKEDFILSLTLQYPEIKVLDFVNVYYSNKSLPELVSEDMSKADVIQALRILLNLD